MKQRCPTCGAPVDSIFDHLGEDCPPEPEGGYPAETYIIKAQPVSEMTEEQKKARHAPIITISRGGNHG